MSTKTEKIRLLLKKAKKSSKELVHNPFIISIKSKLNDDQIDEIIKLTTDIDNWRNFRNELTHAWFNKSLDDLNSKFKSHVEEGYQFGKRIDNYAGMLKRKVGKN